MRKLKLLFLETRPQFLLLTPVCLSVGFASAFYHGYFNPFHAVLALVGSLLAHVSVNVFNDYYDYKRGTDLLTKRTPFSGGSGLLPSGLVTPREAFALAAGSLFAGLAIGAYFITSYPVLVPIVALATFLIYAYTPLLTRAVVTELFPGLGFGPLMVLGAYLTMLPPGSSIAHLTPLVASVVPGILVSNLLLLNEFPDYEADLKTGRRHLVILLKRRKASKVYVALVASAYAWLVASVALGWLPATCLLALLTLPLAISACRGVLNHYDDTSRLVPSMAKNVLITLLTPLLLSLGLTLAPFLGFLAPAYVAG
jgi:1,4-dihydroxy-2-naphthoate octaprenyltransferase